MDQFPNARLALVGFSHNPPSWLKEHQNQSRHPATERTIDLDDTNAEQEIVDKIENLSAKLESVIDSLTKNGKEWQNRVADFLVSLDP